MDRSMVFVQALTRSKLKVSPGRASAAESAASTSPPMAARSGIRCAVDAFFFKNLFCYKSFKNNNYRAHTDVNFAL